MSNISTKVFTKVFSGSDAYTFDGKEGYNKVSILWVSGSPTVTGTGKLGNFDSSAITLSAAVVGLTAVGDDQITGLAIDAAGGSCVVICNS